MPSSCPFAVARRSRPPARSSPASASRAEVEVVERDRKFLAAQEGDDLLQVVAILARHPDLPILNLRLHLDFGVADRRADGLRDVGFEAHLQLQLLPRV